jgi:flagellar hook-associated protein 1 FlgK
MSLTGTLSNALTGLHVAQASINAVANNIVNANTDGYVRKALSQESVVLNNRGAGVEVGAAERIADEFLIAEVRRQATITGRSLALDKYHSLTQDAFGNPSSGFDIGNRVGALSASLEAFTANHETAALGLDVLTSADELTGAINHLSDHVQRLRGEADKEIGQVVNEINNDIEAIHLLNSEIARVENSGQISPELFDKRDLAIKNLAEKIDISTYSQDGNIIAVYTGRGEALLDATPRTVHYNPVNAIAPDATLPAISIFRNDQIDPVTGDPFDVNAGVEIVSSGVRAVLSPELTNDGTPDADQTIVSLLSGGRIQGLIEMRDEVLPALNDQLQELADGLRFAINKAHNDNVSWPQPNSLSGTRTDLSDFAAATRSGTATFAVTDASDGSTVLAFEIDVAALADENDLVGQINTNLGALGTAAIAADGQLEINLASTDHGLAISEGDSSITITDAAARDRDFGLSHYFGLNDFFVTDGPLATDLVVHPDIVANPVKIGTAKLDVTTPPLTATLGGVGDNRGAHGLLDALNADHDVLARGGLAAKSIDLGSYAAEIVAISASNAEQAETEARVDQALSDAVNFRNESVSTVNLDEELASLMTLQQAYSVAARLISTVNEMLDELVDVMRA